MSEKYSSIILIKEIQNLVEKKLNHALENQDITISQAKVLALLLETPDHQATLKHIEKGLDLSQSVTAGLVVRLEQKKYVVSFGDATDKRIKIVQITPLGEQRYHASQKILGKQEDEALSALTVSEKEQFKMFLIKVKNTLQELE